VNYISPVPELILWHIVMCLQCQLQLILFTYGMNYFNVKHERQVSECRYQAEFNDI
jgi:hypothetical protein